MEMKHDGRSTGYTMKLRREGARGYDELHWAVVRRRHWDNDSHRRLRPFADKLLLRKWAIIQSSFDQFKTSHSSSALRLLSKADLILDPKSQSLSVDQGGLNAQVLSLFVSFYTGVD